MNRFYHAMLFMMGLSIAFALPPGGPNMEYGPAKMSLSAFYEHSGQDIFKTNNMAGSIHNQLGAYMTYAPILYMQIGGFVGASEFDHNIPVNFSTEESAAFNSDYHLYWGSTIRLHTPRFISQMVGLSAYGGVGHFSAEDEIAGQERFGWEYQGGGLITLKAGQHVLFGVGGEFYAIDGTQKSADVSSQEFGNQDLVRAVISLDYFPKTTEGALKGIPFINVHFKTTPNIGWDDNLGIGNAAIGVSVGLISNFLYGPNKDAEDERE